MQPLALCIKETRHGFSPNLALHKGDKEYSADYKVSEIKFNYGWGDVYVNPMNSLIGPLSSDVDINLPKLTGRSCMMIL